ncbi:hypothetical protein SporoP37_14080 [Sporosarcina sp. P37]|uniref:hypothetical protein n=1 Tax=unclassified Sporosarcina TaxID=2647733 RepID=UPI0009BC9AB7|nr:MULTISPECIES: hypothetical protein [unclassified Sporosarcina]ARD49194.1 hypothetical protein SporoP33_13735 [Sporosarcina sp. P33]ARK25671.1 hypothetical protein SporoP37_14080 [Sporosarcina sp. P37]PID19307.1 hypothetical protein CSV62_05010 [Sporosarcina sp. P35]
MKAIVRILFLLAAVNGVLIYLHYSQSANADGESADSGTYRQEIEVINRTDGLYIRHHFYNLSEDRHEIIWPQGSVERGCEQEESAPCSRLNESGVAFEEGERDQQSVIYKLPKKQPLTGRKLFKKPFALLKDNKPLTTVLHMTDEQDVGGMWVTGLERVGKADKERITYRLYRGVGFVNELYWQPQDVPLAYSSNKLSMYGVGIDKKQNDQMVKMLEGVGGNHISVVLAPRNQPLYAERIIVEKTGNMPQVVKQAAKMSVKSRFTLRPDEPSMNSMLASLLGDEPVGTKAEQGVFIRLKESLSEEQYQSFRQNVHEQIGKELSASRMDQLLADVMAFDTQYFQKTMHEQQLNYPFLLLDPRTVLLDGKEVPAVKVVVQDGKSFYPAAELLSKMGYAIRSNEQSIYIESPNRKYRFSKLEPFYVMNDRKFDYLEKPHTYINKELYFDENWLRRIFLVLIEKSEKTISIEQIENLIKEMEKE